MTPNAADAPLPDFDLERFVDHLAEFVGFKTVVCRNPTEFSRAADWVRQFMADTDAEFIELECNGQTTTLIKPRESDSPALLADGHVEVVPAADPMFRLRIEGRRAHGRGAADMKTQVVMLLQVLHDLLTSDDHRDFWVVLTEDEEVGSLGGAAAVIDHLARRDALPGVVFVPDGGHDFAYVEKEKGVAAFGVIASGAGGHASRPWLATNPIEIVMAFARDLTSAFPAPSSEDDWRHSVQVTTIHAGDAGNEIPQQCRAGFDLRFTEAYTTDELRAAVTDIADAHGLAVRFSKVDAAAVYPRDTPIGAAYLQMLADVIGRQPRIVHAAGASNGRLYAQAGDVQVLMTGPTAGGAHSRREWVDLDCLPRYHELVHRTVRLVSDRARAATR